MIKKLYPFIFILSTILFAAFFFSFNTILPTGAPDGHTNSPADGKNCTFCHGGSAGNAPSDFITSDIPSEGYTPGESYNITVTSDGIGKKGFQVSPQDNTGNLIGSITAGTDNQIPGTKYVTHTLAKNDDPASWTFQWTAPDQGVGDVTFYGSIVATKSNVRTGTFTISQAIPSSVEDIFVSNISVYPTLVKDNISVNLNVVEKSILKISLISMDGKTVKVFENSKIMAGEFKDDFNIPSEIQNGYYLLNINVNGYNKTTKLYINKQ